MNSKTLQHRIYLDYAATSYPKAPGVVEAIQRYMIDCGASAGRGAYREAFEAKKILDETRNRCARLLQIQNPERLIFTLNATDALNLGLKGVLKPGDHVITSSIEHNSISRPLLELEKKGEITFSKVKVDVNGNINWNEFENAFQPNTKLVAFIHGSNVSGTLTPLQEIGERTRKKGVLFLVDAAQTAGAYPLDVEKMKIDLLAMPGHKALLGPLGTGILWAREGFTLNTLREGGTGSFSEEDTQPEFWPDRHESGSHNLVGISGLNAAFDFLEKTGIEKIWQHKQSLLTQLYEGLSSISNLRVIAPQKTENNAGVISLQFEGQNPQEIAARLDEEFRIQVRPGLHCAPWAHATFETYPQGTLRLSLGYATSSQDAEQTLLALSQIARTR